MCEFMSVESGGSVQNVGFDACLGYDTLENEIVILYIKIYSPSYW